MTNSRIIAKTVLAMLAALILAGVLLTAFVSAGTLGEVASADGFSVKGAAAYLVDSASGTVMYAKNENDRRPIASMVKIMTALLTLEAVERGELSLSENVFVSETASEIGRAHV